MFTYAKREAFAEGGDHTSTFRRYSNLKNNPYVGCFAHNDCAWTGTTAQEDAATIMRMDLSSRPYLPVGFFRHSPALTTTSLKDVLCNSNKHFNKSTTNKNKPTLSQLQVSAQQFVLC